MRYPLSIRRLQISLRTLLVLPMAVGIGLGWFGYQVRWIRERATAREWLTAHGAGTSCGCGLMDCLKNPQFPWSLAVLGEEALPEWYILTSRGLEKTAYRQQIGRLGVLFPECKFQDRADLARARHAELLAARRRLEANLND